MAPHSLAGMADVFTVRIGVRGYEVDRQGHLNQAAYLNYAEHARWEFMRAAGITQDALVASGVGPVTLETTIRLMRELRVGDEVDVSCGFDWDGGRTFRLRQDFHRADGTLVAELTATGGLLDLRERRLVADPRERFRSLAAVPGMLGS
jgi:acyl-CoA thioester hydrolase